MYRKQDILSRIFQLIFGKNIDNGDSLNTSGNLQNKKRLCSLLKINFAQTGMLLQNISPAYGKVLNWEKHRQKNIMSFDKTTLFTSKHRYFMKSSARMLRSTNDIFSFLANSKAERSKYMLVTAIAPPTW